MTPIDEAIAISKTILSALKTANKLNGAKTCKYCDASHYEDDDFCSEECEDEYKRGKKESDRSDDYDRMRDEQYENL